MRVIIVDDQACTRKLVRLMLEEDRAFQVVAEAMNGEEAVSLVSEKRPDLVLMDVQMPRMNGLEATRRIVQGELAPRVVMMSGMDDGKLPLACSEVGASGFIPKSELTLDSLRSLMLAPLASPSIFPPPVGVAQHALASPKS